MPVAVLNPAFSSPDAAPPPWSCVAEALARAEIFWLSTVRRDGRPHVTPLPAVWAGDALHFCAGAHEQKARNLEHDPRVVLTTGTNTLRSGLDVVVEGTAVRVARHATLHRLADLWKERLDWDFEVGRDTFRDPGGRTGLVFAVRPTKVLAFAKGDPVSQTRYRF